MGHTRAVNPVNIYCPVHPHIRGVYRWTSNKACPGDGSSPHTWGIQGARPARRRFLRFIPTYVGYTFVAAPVFTAAAVHPHIRGAYQFPRPVPVPHIGSSPHTWGILQRSSSHQRYFRFIPTYVGHTFLWCFNRLVFVGSSPHTWGIRENNVSPIAWVSVHPHIRGAYLRIDDDPVDGDGSSPHTWGIPPSPLQLRQNRRFIPTYVGHTTCKVKRDLADAVHPHIRGAYLLRFHIMAPHFGSSPHTWGIRIVKQPLFPAARFIPTYVGHTDGYIYGPPCNIGSSPHTWGIPVKSLSDQEKTRFIPTYVGHTLDHRKKNGWFQPLLL